jgi:DNA topoisomerase-1
MRSWITSKKKTTKAETAERAVELMLEPEEAARRAELRYVRDEQPGIRRKRWGRGFTYFDVNGKRIRDRQRRQRFQELAIPPAWTDVWICPQANGHIQATGRDDDGRKQYIYHPQWEKFRNEAKFNQILTFGEMLPQLRARVDKDLRKHGLPRVRILALVVRLLEETLIRVGNLEYAQENGAYGLTTMRTRHLEVNGTKLQFEYRGKGGKKQKVGFSDRRLSRIVQQCAELPGYELFQYVDEEGERQTVESADVNAYLQTITGQSFTAKVFRTWGGTVTAIKALQELGPGETEQERKKKVREAVKQVAQRLGNTTSVCRQYYIHPAVLDAYQSGSLDAAWQQVEPKKTTDDWLQPQEQLLLTVLRRHTEG